MEHSKFGTTLSNPNKVNKTKSRKIDKMVRAGLKLVTILSASIIFFIIFFIAQRGIKPFIGYGGLNVSLSSFLTGNTYFQLPNVYGIGFVILNTLIVVFFAVLISAPIGVLTALFISRMMPKPFNGVFLVIVEMLASIPSIIYGVFGAGFITKMVNGLASLLGMQTAGGLSGLSVILVLAMMILPTITLMSVTSINAVNRDIELGSMALGATDTYTFFKISLPVAKSGIFAGIILGVGRALGEATAVSMVAGNAGTGPNINLFDTTRTLTSSMLLGLKETTGLDYDIRFSIGIVLIMVILISNMALNYVKKKVGRKYV